MVDNLPAGLYDQGLLFLVVCGFAGSGVADTNFVVDMLVHVLFSYKTSEETLQLCSNHVINLLF